MSKASRNDLFGTTWPILAMTLLLASSCQRDQDDGFRVMKGGFVQSVTETGELEAIRAAAISMPRLGYQYGFEYKILTLAEHGSMVNEGDTVIRVDPSSVEKYLISREESLESELAAAKRQRVIMENNLQELQAQLRSEEATFNLRKLELERSRFESENTRRLKELEFRQAEIRLQKVMRHLKVKPELDRYDMIVQETKVKQRQDDVVKTREVLDQLVLTAPSQGLFQVHTSIFDENQLLKVGDRVYLGVLIARIPDVRWMKVRTVVSEADFSKVKPGMPVVVRLDAMPSVTFKGRLTHLNAICTMKEKRKVFNAVVEIEESDLRLKPGMTVSCEFLCRQEEDVYYVPNGCLLRENGKCYLAIPRGGEYKLLEVTAGPSNSQYTMISGDVREGQKLLSVDVVRSLKL